MENEQKSGLSETLETGRTAAHMVRGAVKAGRAVSGAAKGAAAAGPYGAVAGALWENRRLVGKVIIAVIALLLIPVVFVVSLPAVIFGVFLNIHLLMRLRNQYLHRSRSAF